MAQESLPSNVVASAQVLANVANLLNIRDTELSRLVLLSLFLIFCLVFVLKFEFLNWVCLVFLWQWVIFH